MAIKGFDNADVTLFDSETGEKIFSSQSMTISVDVATDIASEKNGMDFSSLNTIRNNGVTIPIPKFTLEGASLARALGIQKHPRLKRLIYLYNRTNSKRIKKKLNNRIFFEVCEHQFRLKEGRYE